MLLTNALRSPTGQVATLPFSALLRELFAGSPLILQRRELINAVIISSTLECQSPFVRRNGILEGHHRICLFGKAGSHYELENIMSHTPFNVH